MGTEIILAVIQLSAIPLEHKANLRLVTNSRNCNSSQNKMGYSSRSRLIISEKASYNTM
jgi:hypothetical protein